MERLEKLVRPHLLKLKPYSSARDDFRGNAEVFLDANENSFGSVVDSDLNRYPDPHQMKLKKKLSEINGVAPDNIFIGNGSDEPIELLIRAFCEPGQDRIVVLPPTYGMYAVSAEVNNVGIKSIALTQDLEIDLSRLQSDLTAEDKLIFICSPNNPTGNLIDSDSIIDLLKSFEGIIIVDEAYIDFADQPSYTHRLAEFPNLVVLQTFSKAWGMAAVRLGVAYANSFVIEVLNKIKPPYNIDKYTQEAGCRALDEIDKKDSVVRKIRDERQKLELKLSNNPLVENIFQSEANFLLVKFQNHEAIHKYLKAKGIITRDRSRELYCEDCLRITVGTPEENEQLLKLLNHYS